MKQVNKKNYFDEIKKGNLLLENVQELDYEFYYDNYDKLMEARNEFLETLEVQSKQIK